MASNTQISGSSTSGPCKGTRIVVLAVACVLLGLVGGPVNGAGQGLGSTQGSLQQNSPQSTQPGHFPQITAPDLQRPNQRQKHALVDSNFKKLKKHAADLAVLAKSLQKEIEKSNENVLSLEIIKKADEVEKLARKVKNEAKGYD